MAQVGREEESRSSSTPLDRIKRGYLWASASLEEGLVYIKASVVGFTKKLTAKSEKEATDADMQAAKLQVAAADRAEDIKKRLQ